MNNVKDSSWYDTIYKGIHAYHVHYTENRYHFIWAIIADRIARSDVNNIIDIGCGTGQFASVLHDRGISNYTGVDFSSVGIEIACSVCPWSDYKFVISDMSQSHHDILYNYTYDCFVAVEFLEHVQNDLDILSQIKSGVKCYASVPNFPFDSHVRHFNTVDEVSRRYELLFDSFHVDALIKNSHGDILYLFEGVKR